MGTAEPFTPPPPLGLAQSYMAHRPGANTAALLSPHHPPLFFFFFEGKSLRCLYRSRLWLPASAQQDTQVIDSTSLFPWTPVAHLLLGTQMPEASRVPQEPRFWLELPSLCHDFPSVPARGEEFLSPAQEPSPSFWLLFPRVFSTILGRLSEDEPLPMPWTDA